MTLGLALGGGAARGAAHIGVLQVLEAHGIVPDLVVGTSAGALIGAAYAAGLDIDGLEDFILAASPTTFGKPTFPPRWALLDSSIVIDLLTQAGIGPDIEDLPLRFGAVATDLRSRTSVLLDSGPVATAVRASFAFPGVYSPVIDGNRILVDGGMLQNLPIQAAFDMGADQVVAVRLAPEWDVLPAFRTGEQIAALEEDSRVVMIHPNVDSYGMWTGENGQQLIMAGRWAAEEAIDARGDELAAA